MSQTRSNSDVSLTETVRASLVPLYRQDPVHVMQPRFLSDDTYSEAIRGMVIVCADVVIVDRNHRTVYLTTRRHLPMAGLWWIGGRVRAGEVETAAIRRNFQRETGLDLTIDRFQVVPLLTRYHWSERQQEPQDVGSDNLCYNFAVELTADELAYAASHLDPNEYDAAAGLRAFSRSQLVELKNAGRLHPVILDVFAAIFQ